MDQLDARAPPPQALRALYKQARSVDDPTTHPAIVRADRLDPTSLPPGIKLQGWLLGEDAAPAFERFTERVVFGYPAAPQKTPVYAVEAIPGLRIYPSLIPPAVQLELLDRMLHRDLSVEEHQTNIHLHYHVSYPRKGDSLVSFFADDPGRMLQPKDPSVHKPLSISDVLNKKLRWMTLGGQYDWTRKEYPDAVPPPFPADLAKLLKGIFPETTPEAAIVNTYVPGEGLSVHRDVSEQCDVGLISISIGCDAVFLISHADDSSGELISLRSGDAVYMGGQSRFAWHGVPKIVPNTCPEYLSEWPASPDRPEYAQWRGWMRGKRVNFNVRQVKP